MIDAVAVVDTNVVVSGLLTADSASPVARVLDGMLDADFRFAVSELLLAEYRTVLLRPALSKLHGPATPMIDVLLTDIAHNAIVLTPGLGRPAPDPGDQFLWDLLASREDLILVTGDKRLLRDRAMSGRVLSPSDFALEKPR